MPPNADHGSVLGRLAGEVRGSGGLLAHTVSPASGDGAYGAVAASGRRAAGREGDYALLVEEIHEGYLLHYFSSGRVVRPEDPDLSLLAGDRLYALGLARLAELGDLAAVVELADVISLAAQAHAEGDPERAAAVWEAGVRVVGDGPPPDHEAAKAGWRGAD
jgi:hypothetical protein